LVPYASASFTWKVPCSHQRNVRRPYAQLFTQRVSLTVFPVNPWQRTLVSL
jgi:hypothetical protein